MANKAYLVQTMDIWSNVTLVGVFNDLKLAEDIIIEEHGNDFDMEDFELVEYPSTFGMVFDQELYNEDSGEFLRIFGYIFNTEEDAEVLELAITGGGNNE